VPPDLVGSSLNFSGCSHWLPRRQTEVCSFDRHRCSWDEEEKGVLHFTAEPIFAQVRFQSKKVELYAKAPLWARLLFTEKKKLQLKEQIESMLEKTGFVSPPKKARK
jgi:hypothetical protein